jgi:hypothetical protein
MTNLMKNLVMAAALVVLGGIISRTQFRSPSGLGTPLAQSHSPLLAFADPPFLSSGIATFNLDEHGRIPFQTTVHKEGQCAGNECFFSYGFVPQGKRLVVTRISGANSYNSTPTQIFIYANNGTGTSIANFIAPVQNNTSSFDHQTEIFYDAGQFVEIQVAPFPATFLGGNTLQVMTVAGYMLNCSVTTPCNAFAANNANHP